MVNKRSQQDNVTNEHGAGLRRLVRGHLPCVCSALACHARSRGFVARHGRAGRGSDRARCRARWGMVGPGLVGLDGARWGAAPGVVGHGSDRARCRAAPGVTLITEMGIFQAFFAVSHFQNQNGVVAPVPPTRAAPAALACDRARPRPSGEQSVTWSLPLSMLCHAALAL